MIEVTKTVPESLHHTCVIATWSALVTGDDGEPVELANFADRSVQVGGTFGAGGVVRIEGSIDGVEYSPLRDHQGAVLDLSSASVAAVAELVRYIRPRVLTGDGSTSITVHVLLKGVTR